MFRSQDGKVQDQQLKVQELVVRKADTHLYDEESGDTVVLVNEPVSAVVSCMVLDDSGPSATLKAAADLSIVDSLGYTPGGDESAIRIDTLALAANDVIVLKYILS